MVTRTSVRVKSNTSTDMSIVIESSHRQNDIIVESIRKRGNAVSEVNNTSRATPEEKYERL